MAFWSRRTVEIFQKKFYSARRWSALNVGVTRDFYYRSQANFFPQCNRGYALSGAQNIHENSIFVRKDATSELDFEAENLHFHYKMWSNETALKQRKKTIFERLWEEPQSPKSGQTEEKYVDFSSLFSD